MALPVFITVLIGCKATLFPFTSTEREDDADFLSRIRSDHAAASDQGHRPLPILQNAHDCAKTVNILSQRQLLTIIRPTNIRSSLCGIMKWFNTLTSGTKINAR